MKISFQIAAAAMAIWLWAACKAATQNDTSAPTRWEDERCDTTLTVKDLTAFDLALPFFQADTLSAALTAVPRVFVVVVQDKKIKYWAAVTASSFKARPVSWQPSPPPLPLPLATSKINLQVLDNEYIWSLVGLPDYPYDRYQPLLQATRDSFLTKRNALMADHQREFPQYELRVQSDLRGGNAQRRHLAMGKSVSPLGQHQFGFAADIGIHYKGKQLQNIERYKVFLNDMGGRYGLAWGGNFKGFVDPNHVQYFQNSSQLLVRFPALRFEFEPFIPYFKNRVNRMTAAGKADKVEDTKALLQTLHQLHRHQPCACHSDFERPVDIAENDAQNKLQAVGYQADKDILLIGNLDAQTAVLLHPAGVRRAVKIGVWQ